MVFRMRICGHDRRALIKKPPDMFPHERSAMADTDHRAFANELINTTGSRRKIFKVMPLPAVHVIILNISKRRVIMGHDPACHTRVRQIRLFKGLILAPPFQHMGPPLPFT